jgi:hypothetical protein
MHEESVTATEACGAAAPSRLSDTELVAAIKHLVGTERVTTVELVAHLAELDTRKLYLGAGFSSLFMYCREVLHLSEHESYHRIEAARAARRFPVLLERLGDGRLNLTNLRLIAPHLTPDTLPGLLAGASYRSKREVEELVVRYFPAPEVPPLIRKLPSAKPIDPSSTIRPAFVPATPSRVALSVPPSRPAVVSPVAPNRYHISFTASEDTRDKLRLAQDLLRHAIPTGDTAAIVDRALTALLEDLGRKKLAETERPRASGTPAAPGSRHVSAAVRRAVWRRDGYQCRFVSRDGRRCIARGFLELHHLKPYGAGGDPTVDNIELRCRAHNAYEADLFYGPRRADADQVGETRAVYVAHPYGSSVQSESGEPGPVRRRGG